MHTGLMKRQYKTSIFSIRSAVRKAGRQSGRLLRNFCRCGIAGWCLEVIFTSSESWMGGDMRLIGRTSLWMFPIYGMGVLLPGIVNRADCWLTGLSAFPDAGTDRISPAARLVRHGLMDMVLIFTAEYITGMTLKHFNVCPWDYSMWPDHIGGVIRLAFAPLWFCTGLLFELLQKESRKTHEKAAEIQA